MAAITPDEGLDWIFDKSIEGAVSSDERIYSIAVGSGSTAVSSSDTQLDTEEFRATVDDSIVTMENTSPAIGELLFKITVSGGTEVPAGTSLSEFGIFARDPTISDGNVTDSDDTLVYREVRPGVSIDAGDRKTFEITLTLINN